MGSGHSSAQLGGHSDVFHPRGRVAEARAIETAGQRRSGINPGAKSAARWLLLALVRAYMIFLSPFFGGACKFYPSCSNYAYEAISRHGARRGFVLAAKRLGRCRPFTKGGFDPVPDASGEPDANKSAEMNSRSAFQATQERRL
jgi:putative membrane protein insertion efficiency factor